MQGDSKGAGNFPSALYTKWLDGDHLVQEDRNDAEFCQDVTCKLDQLSFESAQTIW